MWFKVCIYNIYEPIAAQHCPVVSGRVRKIWKASRPIWECWNLQIRPYAFGASNSTLNLSIQLPDFFYIFFVSSHTYNVYLSQYHLCLEDNVHLKNVFSLINVKQLFISIVDNSYSDTQIIQLIQIILH